MKALERIMEDFPKTVREAAERHRTVRGAIRAVISAVLKRVVACERLSIEPQEADFCKGGFGKPYLRGVPDFHFNVSHSEDWVICAVSADGSIGVDVERIGKAEAAVAEMCFSPGEFGEWQALPESLRDDRFFELWTLKESYVKAIGTGLIMDLSAVEMVITGEEILPVRSGIIDPQRRLASVAFDPDYKLAVCMPVEDASIDLQYVSVGMLLNRYWTLACTSSLITANGAFPSKDGAAKL